MAGTKRGRDSSADRGDGGDENKRLKGDDATLPTDAGKPKDAERSKDTAKPSPMPRPGGRSKSAPPKRQSPRLHGSSSDLLGLENGKNDGVGEELSPEQQAKKDFGLYLEAAGKVDSASLSETLPWVDPASGNVADCYLDINHIMPSIFCVTEAVQWPEAGNLPEGMLSLASLNLPRGSRSSLYRPADLNLLYSYLGQQDGLDNAYRPNPNGKVDIGRVVRPRRTLYLPFRIAPAIEGELTQAKQDTAEKCAHWVLFIGDIPNTVANGTLNNTLGVARMSYYDSMNPGVVDEDVFTHAVDTARHMLWSHGSLQATFGGVPLDPDCDYENIDYMVYPRGLWLKTDIIPTPHQEGGWQCGVHVILNAWCHALGLPLNPQWQAGPHFYQFAIGLINIATNGQASSDLLRNFLCGTSYALNSEVPWDRKFPFTIRFTTVNEVVDHYNYVKEYEYHVECTAGSDDPEAREVQEPTRFAALQLPGDNAENPLSVTEEPEISGETEQQTAPNGDGEQQTDVNGPEVQPPASNGQEKQQTAADEEEIDRQIDLLFEDGEEDAPHELDDGIQ